MWLVLACTSAPIGLDLTKAELADVLEPQGWRFDGCADLRSTGIHRTTCTLRRPDAVAVITLVAYDRAADAERAWSAADAVGWRAGREVTQVDVFDESAAWAILATLPPAGAPLPDYDCQGRVCRGRDPAGRASLVSTDPGGRPLPGYVSQDGWIAAVHDREAAARILAALRGE